MRLRPVFLAVLFLLTLGGTAALAARATDPPAGSKYRPPVQGRLGVVASESPAAARVGRRVLERGGNAIDAAVATVFATGVARPQSCGIGGGGFLVYRSARGKTAALDFRETAPGAFTPQTLQGPGPHTAFTGHLTVGTPGTVAGMAAALRRYGTLSLSRAIAPAERLARRGVTVTPALSQSMTANEDRIKLFPATADEYLVGGQTPYPAGSTLRQPDYARALARIRRRGVKGFYTGRTAKLIVADMRRSASYPGSEQGVLTLKDLAGYRAKWRTPIAGTFRGRTIVAMPPPTSGGIAIQEWLNILEGYDLKALGRGSADTLHLIAEAQKLAWADRGKYVADPDFVKVPTKTLISKAYAARRRREIDLQHAKAFGPGDLTEARHKGSTTHLSVIDRRGNAVAVTCTIEQEFGSAVVAPGAGFLLNNEMTDFGKPGTANESQAYKRPRSSMSPEIAVQRGRPIDVTGGAGGSTIIAGTFFSLLNRIEFGLPLARAVDGPRLDAQQEPTGPMTIEDARYDPAVLAELERRGHTLTRQGEYAIRPRVQAAGFVDPSTRLKDAVSDPRTEAASLAERP